MRYVTGLINNLREGTTDSSIASKYTAINGVIYLGWSAINVWPGVTQTLFMALSEANVWSREFRGFPFGDLLTETPNTLVALEPHRIGRIPVVFIHGTASSAARWADMLNDLLDDPNIGDHFEFWFFSYATGNPIPYSALLLREDLQDAIAAMGGTTADPALGQIVLIGHSQGGLLAKLLVIDTGSRLWDGFSTRPLAELKLTDATRVLLQRMFFLQPLPEVRRVIFIATPHRGSYVAGFSISQMIARLVTVPFHVAQAGAEVLTGNRDALQFTPSWGGFGSIYGMTPGSPLIRALEPIPIVPGVLYNSIIAVQGNGPAESGSDGVVTYKSAHLAGAESELVVPHDHRRGSPDPAGATVVTAPAILRNL